MTVPSIHFIYLLILGCMDEGCPEVIGEEVEYTLDRSDCWFSLKIGTQLLHLRSRWKAKKFKILEIGIVMFL